MAITTQLVGALGSRGYLIATNKPVTYALPPNPQGWSVLFASFIKGARLSFKCTNRKTGATVWEVHNIAMTHSSMNPTPDLAEATRVGMNIEIRNSTDTRICIASGIDNQPPSTGDTGAGSTPPGNFRGEFQLDVLYKVGDLVKVSSQEGYNRGNKGTYECTEEHTSSPYDYPWNSTRRWKKLLDANGNPV